MEWIRKATLLVLGISVAALVAYIVYQCWWASAKDVLEGAPFIMWVISPYAFAIPMSLLQRKTLAPSVITLVGSLLVSTFGWLNLAVVMLESIKGNNEAGLVLLLVPLIQWPGFLVTVALAYLVAGRPFRIHAVLVFVAAAIVLAAAWLHLVATSHPHKYEKFVAMLGYYPVLLGALVVVVLTFLVVRARPRIEKAES
jgi:hypothetical protein